MTHAQAICSVLRESLVVSRWSFASKRFLPAIPERLTTIDQRLQRQLNGPELAPPRGATGFGLMRFDHGADQIADRHRRPGANQPKQCPIKQDPMKQSRRSGAPEPGEQIEF